MNPWTIESVITNAKAMAERNGFELLPGEYNIFTGYEQAKMEIDALAKGKK